MNKKEDQLKNKKILIVDDEPDVLDTLEELLHMCQVVRASNFNSAKDLLEKQEFDIAILDIMGVDGYSLLEIASKKKITVIMLTAHALTPQDTSRSFKGGAAYFIPKEFMENITTYLTDVLEAQKEKKSTWWSWGKRFSKYYDRRFGPDWTEYDRDFWKMMFWS